MGFPKNSGKVLKSPRVVVCFWRWRDTVHSCAWPAGWGLSCPPRVAIRRTTPECCSFISRFSSRFPAPPKEVKVHTGTDYRSMVSECQIWPSGGQESKKKPAAAQCSRLVTHVKTLWPLRCLSARIGRDAEGSSRYGRR